MLRWLATLGGLVALLAIFMPGRAYAYLDPASTSFLYQVGYYVFYAILGFLVLCWRHIKTFLAIVRVRLMPGSHKPQDKA